MRLWRFINHLLTDLLTYIGIAHWAKLIWDQHYNDKHLSLAQWVAARHVPGKVGLDEQLLL